MAKLAAEAGDYATFIRTLAYTGLRWGETIALRVRDVDLTRRRIRVHRAYADQSGKLVEGSTKTHQARDVPIPPSLCAELDPVLSGKVPDDLVFAAPTGGPLRSTNFAAACGTPPSRQPASTGSPSMGSGTPPRRSTSRRRG